MKRTRMIVFIVMQLLCGQVLHIAYEASGGSVWSWLISGINSSPWEHVKPFALVYYFWSFIELSVYRPHLDIFVSARILSLLLFVVCCPVLLYFCPAGGGVVVPLCLCVAEMMQMLIYHKARWTKHLLGPLLLAALLMLAALLFFSFYPPAGCVFRPV